MLFREIMTVQRFPGICRRLMGRRHSRPERGEIFIAFRRLVGLSHAAIDLAL